MAIKLKLPTNPKNELRIPTILGLVLLLGGTAVGVVLTSRQNSSLFTRASTDCTPQSVQVANITERSADISFQTNSECLITLSINNRIYQDIRKTLLSSTQKTKNHYYQIDDLSSGTEYKFTAIADDGKSYPVTQSFSTSNKITAAIPSSRLAWGKIITPDNTPAPWAIVYIKIPGASLTSAFVTSSGNWNIPLSVVLNENKTSWYIEPTTAVGEDITVLEPNYPATIITNSSNNNNPVPDIILGKNGSYANTPVTTIASGSLGTQPTNAPSNKNFAITYPSDGETVGSPKPEFLGTGTASSSISLTLVGLTTLSGTATTDNLGNWRWSPPANLPNGNYKLTAQWNQATLERQFTLSLNNSLAFTSTSSATLAPLPTSTIILSPTTTMLPTLVPTTFATSTPLPTSTVALAQPTGPSLNNYKTGGSLPTWFMIIGSVTVVSVGILLRL